MHSSFLPLVSGGKRWFENHVSLAGRLCLECGLPMWFQCQRKDVLIGFSVDGLLTGLRLWRLACRGDPSGKIETMGFPSGDSIDLMAFLLVLFSLQGREDLFFPTISSPSEASRPTTAESGFLHCLHKPRPRSISLLSRVWRRNEYVSGPIEKS